MLGQLGYLSASLFQQPDYQEIPTGSLYNAMPAISKLSDDLLSQILCLAAGSALYAKFDLAQVSARWRSVALNSPQLWTQIHIASQSQFYGTGRRRFALVLERTGSSALLDVVLSGPFRKDDALYMATALVPYAARIRVLDTPDDNFDALLTSARCFPALGALRVRGVGGLRKHGPQLDLTAPCLRELYLNSVPLPIRFKELFSDRIEEVSIHYCDDIKVTDLLAVIARCVHLVHLEFSINTAMEHREEVSWDVPPLRRLKSLTLVFPFPEILDMLDNAVDRDTVLHTLTVSTSCNRDADCVLRLCAAVTRGLGALISLKFHDKHSFVLRDDAGSMREIKVGNLSRNTSLQVWPHLAMEHSAQTTVRELHVPYKYWNDFAEGLAKHPPGSQLRSLRILTSEYDFEGMTESKLPALKRLVLPGLERVEILASRLSLPPAGVSCLLRSISAGDAACPIKLTVSGLTESVEYLRDLIETNGSAAWDLVGIF